MIIAKYRADGSILFDLIYFFEATSQTHPCQAYGKCMLLKIAGFRRRIWTDNRMLLSESIVYIAFVLVVIKTEWCSTAGRFVNYLYQRH